MISAGRAIGNAVEGVRRYLSRGLAVTAAAWALTGVLALLVLAPGLAGGDGWAAGSMVPLTVVLAALAVVAGGILHWKRQTRWWGAEHRIARSMDAVIGLEEGAVLGGLELSRAAPAGTSSALRALALQRVSRELEGDWKALSGGAGEKVRRLQKRGLVVLMLTAPLALAVLALAPARTVQAWQGLLKPLTLLSEPSLPPITVMPGTAEVPRGAEIEVKVGAPMRDSVILKWSVTGQVTGSRTLLLDEGAGTGTLPPTQSRTRYWIEAPDGAASEVHTLTPIDPLFISNWSVEVTYPPHTGLPADEYRNEIPAELALPAGSHLRFTGDGSRALGRAVLIAEKEEAEVAVELTVRGSSFEGGWVPRASGTYLWRMSDLSGGAAAVAPDPLTLQLVQDQPPEVAILFPVPDTLLPVNRRQPLVVQSGDDYGVQRVEIVAWKVNAFEEAGERVTRGEELGGAGGAILRPVLDASGWELSPGDEIHYLARALDNHPSQQITETAEYILRVPGSSELNRAVQEEMDRAAQSVESLAEEARQAEEESRNLRLQEQRNGEEGGRRDGESAGFEDREKVAEALERQSNMRATVDSLQQELARLREALEDTGLADGELEEQLQGLEELLEHATSSEEDRSDEAGEKLDDMNAEELQEVLDRMLLEQERLRDRLEQSVEQFKRAALDQDFRATSQETAELADEQELLAEALAEGGEAELRAEQQAALEERAGDLREQLESLQERLQEAGEQSATAGVQEARHQMEQARQQMQQAAQMAQQGQQQAAAEQAAQAAGELSRASQELDQAQMQMQQQMMQKLQEAMGRTATGALALARRQSELRQEMQGAGASEMAELRGDVAAIARGVRNLTENYATETEMAAPGSRDLLASAGQAMEALDATITAMESARGRGGSAMAEAEGVVRALNEVARLALTSGQQGGQGQAAASASQQMMQQLQQLAQQQGEIMQDMSSLSPMQLGEETLSQQMDEMAERQEEVAEELDEVSEGGSDEGDPLGDLERMAEEARQLAEALAGGRLDPEVLARQERLFHRLLDAGRSLERDEDAEEREAEQPGTFVREGAGALSAQDLDAMRFALPGAAVLRALSPAQRALVVRYFERLNRAAPGDSAPPRSR